MVVHWDLFRSGFVFTVMDHRKDTKATSFSHILFYHRSFFLCICMQQLSSVIYCLVSCALLFYLLLVNVFVKLVFLFPSYFVNVSVCLPVSLIPSHSVQTSFFAECTTKDCCLYYVFSVTKVKLI